MSFTLVTHKHIHRGNAGNIYQGGFWLLTWIYHLLQPRPPFRGNSDPFHQSSFDKATVKHTHVQIHFDFFFAMQLRLPRTYFKIPETKGEWVEGKWVKYLSPEIRKHGHGKKKRKKHGMVRDRKLSVCVFTGWIVTTVCIWSCLLVTSLWRYLKPEGGENRPYIHHNYWPKPTGREWVGKKRQEQETRKVWGWKPENRYS